MSNYIVVQGKNREQFCISKAAYAKSQKGTKEDYVKLYRSICKVLQNEEISKHQKKRLHLEKGRVHRLCKRTPSTLKTNSYCRLS